MRDRIIVKKELMPYGFYISLGTDKFNLYFSYNLQSDLFTVSLRRDGQLLCAAEPVVYGVPLFSDIYESGLFPMLDIVPLDESGNEYEITRKNFGETVFLTINNGK